MKLLLENWRKFLKEDTEPYPYQIYCDMDGVLVDFEEGAVSQINQDIQNSNIQTPEIHLLRATLNELQRNAITTDDIEMNADPSTSIIDAARSYLEKEFADNVDFWATLPWMPDGKELWQYISPFHPYILTAPMGEGSKTGKREWIKNNLKPLPEKIFISKDKYKWAITTGRPNVLIDDFLDNTGPWLNKGGFAIQHKNYADTKAGLEYIATSPRQKSTS